MKLHSIALALACASLSHSASAQSAPTHPPLESVEALELSRYLGTWYQVALYPNSFQSQCVSDTTATYRGRTDGAIEVVNRCRNARGDFDEAIGVARPTGALDGGTLRPAQLEVTFLPAWLRWAQSFGHWGWGAYWVIQLAPDYRYTVVSEGSREYLWVLSRTSALAADDEASIRGRLREQGFDLARLRMHLQGKATPTP